MQENSTDIRYPLELKDMKYFITFRARDYSYKNKSSLDNVTVEMKNLCNISLYFPQNFQESLSQNWSPSEVFTEGTVGGKALSFLKGKAGDPIYNATISKQGVTINPSEELLYQGPGFRNLSFSFDLLAKNKNELDAIKKIEALFKVLCLPRIAKNKEYIAFPAIWEIEIIGLEDESEGELFSLGYKGKYFGLTNYEILYTPEGTYTPLVGGHPVKTNINLSFTETAPLYRKELTGEPEVKGIIASVEGFLGL